jgi:hypothetical protein
MCARGLTRRGFRKGPKAVLEDPPSKWHWPFSGRLSRRIRTLSDVSSPKIQEMLRTHAYIINAYPIKNCLSDLIGGFLGEELMPVEVWDLCRVVSDGHLVQKPTSRIRWSATFLDITPSILTLWGFSVGQLAGTWMGQTPHSWYLEPAVRLVEI